MLQPFCPVTSSDLPAGYCSCGSGSPASQAGSLVPNGHPRSIHERHVRGIFVYVFAWLLYIAAFFVISADIDYFCLRVRRMPTRIAVLFEFFLCLMVVSSQLCHNVLLADGYGRQDYRASGVGVCWYVAERG
jgi:hypothetical protein